MKRAWILTLVLLAGCAATQDDRPRGPTIIDMQEPEGITIVEGSNDVGEFRGTRMARMLQVLDGEDRQEWTFVRRHVVPAPRPPSEEIEGRQRVNYPWPPASPNNLSKEQRAWRSYLLWPAHIRELLQAPDWSELENRRRLAQYGRMYELTYRFQKTPPHGSPTMESEHWRQYAESMLAYGKDGEALLVSNMILALTNPEERTIMNAQSILVQVGEGAIEPLCGALWLGFRQATVAQDGSTTVQGHPNFNKYVIDTLYRIGPRVAPHAIFELENTLDDNGQATGTAWRFRKHFVELLGRVGDAQAVRTLEAELVRCIPTELDSRAMQQGRQVVDPVATDTARFLYREYLLQALGGLREDEGLRAVIRIWQLDEEHTEAAITAVQQITGRRVRTVAEARDLATQRNVKLDE